MYLFLDSCREFLFPASCAFYIYPCNTFFHLLSKSLTQDFRFLISFFFIFLYLFVWDTLSLLSPGLLRAGIFLCWDCAYYRTRLHSWHLTSHTFSSFTFFFIFHFHFLFYFIRFILLISYFSSFSLHNFYSVFVRLLNKFFLLNFHLSGSPLSLDICILFTPPFLCNLFFSPSTTYKKYSFTH